MPAGNHLKKFADSEVFRVHLSVVCAGALLCTLTLEIEYRSCQNLFDTYGYRAM